MLEHNGYRILSAGSGDEALRLTDAHSGTIDLLLTDLVMPGMSGLELADRITAADPRRKVVFMSGYPAGTEDGTEFPTPNRHYLQKPFDQAGLLATLTAALERSEHGNSEPPAGARLELTPRVREARVSGGAPTEVRLSALPTERGSVTILSMPTVLIADDHPSFRASARAILESDGYEVVGEAEDGAQALALTHELRPDVLLLDVQLPDMTGFNVCSSVCANGYCPTVVLVSSRDASDYGSLIEQSGARGFIAKAELSGAALADLMG